MNDKITPLDHQSLSVELADMQWEISPERDLWPDIEQRLSHLSPIKKNPAQRGWMPYAVAACLILTVASTFLASMAMINSQRMVQAQEAMALYHQAQLDLIEQQHQLVRVQVVKLLALENNNLNPNLVAEMKKVMVDVDLASAQIKNAIKLQPNNPEYPSMLVSTYQHELKLLNRIRSGKVGSDTLDEGLSI